MTEHAPDRVWSGIDIPKTLAGAIAAVCAAVIGSFLGVAGTLVGAAVASVVGSVGTEIWHRSIRKGTQKLQTSLVPTFVKAPAAVGTPEVAAATEEDSPSHVVPEDERSSVNKLRWKRIALAAGALFVLSIGALTAVELVAGRSVASMVGHGSSGTTTLSSVTGGSSKGDDKQPASTSTSPTPGPTSTTGEQGGSASTAPTETTDGGTPTSTATSPTTEAPTTDAPDTTTTGGTGQTDQKQSDQKIAPDSGGDNAQ
jgi:hypothetical protein